MPIGKNAIKRVNKNGYSSVVTSAPDMENSEIREQQAPQAPEERDLSPITTVKKVTKKQTKKPAKKQERAFVAIGDEMPIYLL